VAAVGVLVGFVLYGLATPRARVLTRWYGLVAPRFHARFARLGEPRDGAVRADPGGPGPFAVVAKGRHYRWALPRAANLLPILPPSRRRLPPPTSGADCGYHTQCSE